MKKFFAVGATAALLLAASSPAFGLGNDNLIVNDSGNTDVQFVDASQFQFAAQGQFGSATAIDDSFAIVASDQGITQNQANAGLGEIEDLNQGVDYVGDIF